MPPAYRLGCPAKKSARVPVGYGEAMTGKRSSITAPAGGTIFARMTQLATETRAVNLGQGFPDSDGPATVRDTAIEAINGGHNQYPPARGTGELLAAIARHQQRWYGIELDPASEILVTTGATEAIAASVLSLVSPGDEVVMFEPYYDSYAAMVERAGGVRRTVPLRFPDFAVDEAALEAAFSERTAVVLLNTPHNPTGKVLTREELAFIGELATRHDAIVMCDEVYEHLAFAPHEHVPMATLPGMAERTLTFGSGGKTFNTTGWKIGWVTGPADLVAVVNGAKQYVTFGTGTPLQLGIASGLEMSDDFFTGLREDMALRRDVLADGLRAVGFDVVVPQGGYFVLADAAPHGVTDAEQYALELPEAAGVVAVPASVFCDDAEASGMASVMRFAFCKKRSTIDEAVRRLVDTYGQRA